MKTILIIIGGMADRPDIELDGRTPLMAASTPSLDALAKCGCCGLINNVPDNESPTLKTAVLSLMGYDFSRGVPSDRTLSFFSAGLPFNPSEMRFFVIPKFSGHGVVVSDDPVVRGIGMMAMLRPLFPMGEGVVVSGGAPTGTLRDKALLAIKAIEIYDFVMVYVGEAFEMSLNGDVEGKMDVLERIDRELITPVADYVWNARLQMNLVVTGDLVTSWRDRATARGEVPAVVYFNDDLPYDMKAFDEKTVAEGPLNAPLPGDLMRLLASFEPFDDEKGKGGI
ncbi:MAG: hypothetical protein K2M27_06550 [Muribaculaceae bacterium]|nr:hypothetical protein [Muribaculaceae bacterium]